MTSRTPIPTAPAVVVGLVGGFAAARYARSRPLGGLVLGSAGAWCASRWLRDSGPAAMGLLLGAYLAAFGVSHPLAHRIGAWPAVLAVTAPVAGAAFAAVDRRRAAGAAEPEPAVAR